MGGRVPLTARWMKTFITLHPDGTVGARRGNIGPPVDPSLTTRVVEFNDVPALEQALAHGDSRLPQQSFQRSPARIDGMTVRVARAPPPACRHGRHARL